MSKRIIVKSFSALSFDVIVRQAPVRAMHSPRPMPKRGPAITQDGDLPVEAGSPVDSAKTNRTKKTGCFPDRNHPAVNGSDRAAWAASTSSVR